MRHRLDALADQGEALLDEIAADPGRADLARRITLLTSSFREARDYLAGHVFADALAGETAAREPAPPAPATVPRPGRHRASPGGTVIPLLRRRPGT